MCISSIAHNCFVPPYMLREIYQNGTAVQQKHAQQNLASSWQFRVERAATTGAMSVLEADDFAVSTVMERLVYDAEHGTLLPGRLVMGEGDPPTDDKSGDEAYEGAGATYELFKQVYGRNSIDGRGMPIVSTVHYGVGYDNAFWNGNQMVYGDGDEDLPLDQRLFNRFTISMDIMGHELTHGITQYEAGLLYNGQSGALNEAISDIFGILVKQYYHDISVDESDWLIGTGLFTENVSGIAIRSMKEPGTAYNDPILGKDPQPGHMDDYVNTIEDAGGVHINSGILNRAFYVMAMELGGKAWEKAGQIWYVTLSEKLFANADFDDAARLTYEAAGELYDSGSLEQKAVRFGWEEVGLSVGEIDEGDGGNNEDPDNSGTVIQRRGCFDSFMNNDFIRRLFGRF
ncbi:MAG: M4 family metallopeptidase [Candidatus Promineifilaceae bacterium]|jgi:Zn-dependent metalloprotease